MRHYMVDPENEERLLKIPPHVVAAIKAEALDAAREAVAALEPLLNRSKHEGGYDCCGCATVGYVWTDALDALDDLVKHDEESDG